MKRISEHRWITAFVGFILLAFLVFPVHAQLMLAHEGHHDGGGCEIKGGEFPITFSGYEVPEGNIPPMHSYCSNIPTPGAVQLTIELPDWDSRKIPLAVRLVEAGHGGHGSHDSHQMDAAEASNNDNAEDEVVDHDGHDMHGDDTHDQHAGHGGEEGDPGENDIEYIPYTANKSGIIVVSADLQKGDYEILLERKDDAGQIVVAGRVPFAVGGSGGHAGHGGGFGLMEIGLAVLAIGGGAFFFMRRKTAAKDENKA